MGEQLKLKGIGRATAATDPRTMSKIDYAINLLAQSGREFSSDDVWHILAMGGITVEHPNVVGGRFRYWRKQGRIQRLSVTTQSARARRHGATLFLYRGI